MVPFRQSYQHQKVPLILQGLSLGPCFQLWKDTAYWKNGIGEEKASVHVCREENMNFVEKNYSFKVISFADMIEQIFNPSDPSLRYYFRSLGDNPRKEVSNIQQSYPQIAHDFQLPACCEEAMESRFFSSALRFSSARCRLWTHYDVMDNFLFNVIGRKLVTLYPPAQSQNLYPNGSSSPVVDIDHPDLTRFPNFPLAQAAAIQFVLEPGDTLFLPALWWHNVLALEPCISVNVFFKDSQIQEQDWPPKDLYGNKDILPAAKAFKHIELALSAIKDLPETYQDFYRGYFKSLIDSKKSH